MLRYWLHGAGDAMNLRQAAEMALEAMEKYCECGGLEDPIEALRQALAQPKQEPGAVLPNDEPLWMIDGNGNKSLVSYKNRVSQTMPDDLIATYKKGFRDGAKRKWVGLTDEEIGWLWHNSPPNSHEYARAIEAKLKEKNSV